MGKARLESRQRTVSQGSGDLCRQRQDLGFSSREEDSEVREKEDQTSERRKMKELEA